MVDMGGMGDMGGLGGSDDESHDETLYEVLLCAPSATEHELRQAYKQQALHWHPDKNGDPDAEERFKKINAAWSILSDEHKRAAYDHSLINGENIADHCNFDQAAQMAATIAESEASLHGESREIWC